MLKINIFLPFSWQEILSAIRQCSTLNSGTDEDGLIITNKEEMLRSLVDRKFRSTNPDGLEGGKYVKGLCDILYSLDPRKYPFLAGFSNRHVQNSEHPKILKLETRQQTFIAPIRMSFEGGNFVRENSKDTSIQTIGGQSVIVSPDADIGEFYENTTADFVRRTIRSSEDIKVKENCNEMLQLINTIALSEEQGNVSNPMSLNNSIPTEQVPELESRCVDLFNEWIGKSKLGLGYLFYLTKQKNGWGDEFITKIVHHMAPRVGELVIEEIVMLMLMMYFRRDKWNMEELFEFLDPTQLQKKLADMIDSKRGLSDAELCAICLGLRHITEFTANIDEFRDALYRRMTSIGDALSSDKAFELNSSHLAAMNMAVIQISVLLQQGYHIGSRDPARYIIRLLKSYEDAVIAYDENGVSKESSNGRFLMETRAASKIMMFGSSKGGLHNQEVTARVIERLMLGKHIRHLALRDLVSFLKFLGQVKEFGTYSTTSEFQIADVVNTVLSEIRDMTNENENDLFYGIKDIMLILQSWVYLSAFDKFDLENIRKVMNAVKELPHELFEENSSIDMKERNLSLGRVLSYTCYNALYPNSYLAYQQQDPNKRESLSPQDYEQFTRLISSLDRTIKIYLNSDTAKELLIGDEKLKFMIMLNQSKVPAIFHEKTKLPATIILSRRQQLVYAVYKGLISGLGDDSYVSIVHVLPHFREPDIVFGHIAGNKITFPSSISDLPDYEIKPAPEVGEWTVISVDAPSSTAKDLGELAKTGEYAPEHANPERHRQLMRLGYQIYPLSARDQKEIIRGSNVKFAHRILANILTGNTQDDPNPRSTPVY